MNRIVKRALTILAVFCATIYAARGAEIAVFLHSHTHSHKKTLMPGGLSARQSLEIKGLRPPADCNVFPHGFPQKIVPALGRILHLVAVAA